MHNKQKFCVELSCINPVSNEYNYAKLPLPATPMEIEDAFQKARITDGREYEIEILCCPKLPDLEDTMVDGLVNIKELNLFAKRLDVLSDDELTALGAIYKTQIDEDVYGLSLEKMINMTYGLNVFNVVPGITTDEALGEFVLDNNLNEELMEVPRETLKYINRSEVGKSFRESENGQFFNKCYVTVGEYKFPTEYVSPSKSELTVKNDIAFALLVAEAPVNDSEETAESAEWIYLPMDRNEADRIASLHNEAKIEDCVFFEFKSAFTQITDEMVDSMDNFDKLNRIAQRYAEYGFNDRVKFKAVLESWEPKTLEFVETLMDDMNKFDFSYYDVSEGNFAKSYLQRKLPTDFDMDLFKDADLHSVGSRILEGIEAWVTHYGTVSCRGGDLNMTLTNKNNELEQNPEIEEEETQNEGFGGMSL